MIWIVAVVGGLLAFAVIGGGLETFFAPFMDYLGKHLEKTPGAMATLGPNPKRLDKMTGQEGIALTPLLPSGKIQIGDMVYDALAAREGIEAGSPVMVLSSKCHSLIVERKDT